MKIKFHEKARPYFNMNNIFAGIGIFMTKIRLSQDYLISIMGIPILATWYFILKQHPGTHFVNKS